MKKFWTDKLDNLLRRHYPKGDLGAMAARLGVTRAAVKSRARKLGIRRKVNVKHPWSDRQLRLLRERFADTTMPELVRLLKHNKDSIENKAHELRLRKSRKYITALGRKTAQMPQAIAHRFKKGQAPANKGKRAHEFRSPEAIAKCRQTEFKPGQRPHNVKPVGYERTDKDGYVYIKVEDGRPLVLKHRYVWQQHHGEIPKGMNVMFRDGNRQNCDIQNLELVSRQEAARRQIQRETPEQRHARIAKRTETQRRNDRMDKIRLHWGLPLKGKRIKRW